MTFINEIIPTNSYFPLISYSNFSPILSQKGEMGFAKKSYMKNIILLCGLICGLCVQASAQIEKGMVLIGSSTNLLGNLNSLGLNGISNNAGIQFRKPMFELATADWRRVIDTNLTSAFLVGREAARRMAKRGSGKIINVGSLTSELARATVAPYTVAKGGIKMLTKAMAAEWGEKGIQVNAIGPGYMVTDMNQALLDNPDFDAWVKGRTPMRRWGLPEELAGTAIYLASNASNYVSGQIIYADGGMTSVL